MSRASFKYTHPNSKLSDADRRFYEENGYLVVKNNVKHELLDEMRQRFIDICDEKVKHSVFTIMKDPSLKGQSNVKGEYLINKLQDFSYDEIFWKYCSCNDVVDVIENIIGPNIAVVHSMFINKPPNAAPGSSLHPLHQDLHYFPFRPAEKIVASWTALEPIDETNGGLYVIPGSHKGVLLKHEYPKDFKNHLYHGILGLEHLPRINLGMDKGDTVFFHPILLHGSGPNTTKGFRKAISCHYADNNCNFIDVHGTSQNNILVEVEELMKRRGIQMDFVDAWKNKSRLIRGTPGNFQKANSKL